MCVAVSDVWKKLKTVFVLETYLSYQIMLKQHFITSISETKDINLSILILVVLNKGKRKMLL